MTAQESPLPYSVMGSSGHNGNHIPENILMDDPKNSNSRWTTSAFPSLLIEQWIMLRLDEPALLESISFGKHLKTNPCTIKEFRVLAGPSEETLHEVLVGTIKNDFTLERFSVNCVDSDRMVFPTRIIKIIPLSTQGGTTYRASLWHVSLKGNRDGARVREVSTAYEKSCEEKTLRYMLKFLRERQLTSSYQALLKETGIKLEYNLVQALYQSIVSGDFKNAELALEDAAPVGLYTAYMQTCAPTAVWTQLTGADADGNVPPSRGGHAACIDESAGLLYIHGGWDGERNLGDFWVYTLADDRWCCLSTATSSIPGGPRARSCHRMVFDDASGAIYLLGGMSLLYPRDEEGSEGLPRVPLPGMASESGNDLSFNTDFYRYHTRGANVGRWERLVAAETSGPLCGLFDHQMVLDSERQMIYVYGGQTGDPESDEGLKYSGMFSYSIREKIWTSLPPPTPTGPSMHIPSRAGHAMVYDSNHRIIFIFGSNLNRGVSEPMDDMWAYNADTHVATRIFSHISAAGGPSTNVQRAVIDVTMGEIYLFCGLTRENTYLALKPDSCWIYKYNTKRPIDAGTFIQVQDQRSADDAIASRPLPRLGHQVVYHPPTKTMYMAGGNAGLLGKVDHTNGALETRLDDLWRLSLQRPPASEIVRKGRFLIRSRQFQEMCAGSSPVKALQFLQKHVALVVDMEDSAEAACFQTLLTHLLSVDPDEPETAEPAEDVHGDSEPTEPTTTFNGRMELFRQLLRFYPADAKEPTRNLSDMVVRGG